jgi:hypothetical protein
VCVLSDSIGPSMATLLQKLGVGADSASTTLSSDMHLKSLLPWALSLNDAPSVDLRDALRPCIVQELSAVANSAVSLEPPISIPISPSLLEKPLPMKHHLSTCVMCCNRALYVVGGDSVKRWQDTQHQQGQHQLLQLYL